VASVFFLLGADFVGAIQLLVYVGGTMVLVVFGVMLTAQGPFINMRATAAEWGISTLVGLILFAVLAISALPTGRHAEAKKDGEDKAGQAAERPQHSFVAQSKYQKYAPKGPLSTDPTKSQYSDTLGLGFLGIGVGPVHEEGGKVVRTHYFLPFLIVSVHLLVVLIGAAYLARAKRRPVEGRTP